MTLLDMPIRKHRRQWPDSPRNGNSAPRAGSRPRPRVRLSVDQYHQMIERGILEEGAPIELLDGRLEWKDRSATGADPMTVGTDHAFSIEAAKELDPKLRRLSASARVQLPVTLPPYNEPEPDVSVVRGGKEHYRDHHPGSGDILCLIEVADSSLIRDRGRKLRIYADSGIALYVILNLIDQVAEVYSQPLVGKGRYAQATTLGLKDRLTIPTPKGKGLTVPVRKLFP
jgi:Uma2 family endonuclease